MSGRRVAIVADDFGLHQSIDEGILALVEQGVVTGVSILIGADNFSVSRSESLFRSKASLGLHLAITETRPLSPALHNPWVVAGRFQASWQRLALQLIGRTVPLSEIVQEWTAQWGALADLAFQVGREISYVDSHQNVHLVPAFYEAMKQFQSRIPNPKLRVFYDRANLLRHPLRSGLMLAAQRAYRDQSTLPTYGLFQSGRMDEHGLRETLIAGVRGGRDFAVMMHPGLELPKESTSRVPDYRLCWQQEFALLGSKYFSELCEELQLKVVPVERLSLT